MNTPNTTDPAAQQQPIITPVVNPVTPTVPAPQQQQQPPQPAPAAPVPAAQAAEQRPAGLEGMTDEQLNELAARIEQARATRPPSIANQLEQIRTGLTASHREKDEALGTKNQAKETLDKVDAAIAELHRTQRRVLIMEAATAAGFHNPALVADHLANTPRDADVTQLVTALAAGNPYMVKTPATSADIGANTGGAPAPTDPGLAGLAADIARNR